MSTLSYIHLNEVNPNDFLALLNSHKIREHLMEHELFDANFLQAWVEEKLEVDATPGCKVRAVVYNGQLAGWCGLQLEDGHYEIAIIIDNRFWGIGKKVFRDLIQWAKELGHKEIYIHFLQTRPDYKFLQKISKSVYKSKMFGNTFTTYQLEVK